jgi:glycosyltransferase involved in cell wall biosynthesis
MPFNNRVLFACSDFGSKGGIQRFNRNLVLAFEKKGFVVDIVSLKDTTDRNVISTQPATNLYGAGGNRWKWIWLMLSITAKNKYKSYICGHINLATAFQLVMIVCFRFSANTCLVLHGIDVWGRINGSIRISASLFRNVMSVSRYTLNSFIEQMNNLGKNKHYIFPNTINPDLYNVPSKSNERKADDKIVRLLSVTRLDKTERDKGVLHVIESISHLQNNLNIQYRIVGDGDDLPHLKELVEKYGLAKNVMFLGALEDNLLWEEYRNADIFVLPSSKEGFGIVFLEAMYFSLPVIGAAEKGALDVIKDGKNGYLVQFGNLFQIAEKIKIIAKDSEHKRRLGGEGKSVVARCGTFGFDSFADRAYSMFIEGKGNLVKNDTKSKYIE